jgi:hypothetical protein
MGVGMSRFKSYEWIKQRLNIALSVSGLSATVLTVGLVLSPGNILAGQNGPLIPATNSGAVGTGVLRTPDDIARDSALVATRGTVAGIVVNAPTIPLPEYNALKASMATSPATEKPEEPSGPLISVSGVNFAGAVQHENGVGTWPPDVDGAVGSNQIVQTTNSSIDVWSKVTSGTPAHLASFSENSLVGSTDNLGDGRVVYDFAWQRWVILIDDFSNLANTGKPEAFLAISKTSNAAGSYFVFPISMNTSPSGLFFDFPQLGMDQDAILITGNWFSSTAFVSPAAFSIAKARVYNGFGFGFSFGFPGSAVGTIAPPIVLAADQNSNDYFLSAPVGTSQTHLDKFTMTEAGRTGTTFSGPINIPVSSYCTPPPLAPQTCGSASSVNAIDTSDGRFQNRSVQYGVQLWNTHTIALGCGTTFPEIRWYAINSNSNSIIQSGNIFLDSTSFDFNPGISSAFNSSAALTWTATDPNNTTAPNNAMMIMAGRQTSDPLNSMTENTTPLVTSATCSTQNFDPNFGHQRWGDYSSSSVDSNGLSPNNVYWIFNEFTAGNSTTNTWATEVARVVNP